MRGTTKGFAPAPPGVNTPFFISPGSPAFCAASPISFRKG